MLVLEVIGYLLGIGVLSGAIWFFGKPLEDSARAIGDHLRLPSSVRGAVLYAIPSSFPELAVVVIAVLLLETPQFGIGLGTVVGSAVFNILIIPGLSVLAAGKAVRATGKEFKGIYISSQVIWRDGLFYAVTVALLLCVAFWGGEWVEVPTSSGGITEPSMHWGNQLTPLVAWGFLAMYGLYIALLSYHTYVHRKTLKAQDLPTVIVPNMSLRRATALMIGSMAVVGLICYVLVMATMEVATLIAVPPYVVAVILTAAATSVPDMVISYIAAQKGGEDAEDAIVNAFSSNIFDILVCLSVPVLILGSAVTVDVETTRMSLILLPVVTLIALRFMRSDHVLDLKEGCWLLFFYFAFVVSAAANAWLLEQLDVLLKMLGWS